MSIDTRRLDFVYEGWSGYNESIVKAVAPLTRDQLSFRPHPEARTTGGIAWHIANGRVAWFAQINARACVELQTELEGRKSEPMEAEPLVDWLNRTWKMVEATLDQWTVDDIAVTYNHPYQGKIYAVSRQWTIWRIMCHDIHHGGQLSERLSNQGIEPFELTLLGGHLTEPPLAEETP